MSIFVYNNPNGIVYDSYVLMFIHSWYMPTLMGEPVAEDTWLRVPAVSSEPYSSLGDKTYTVVNDNIRLISTLDIAEETGKVIKAFRARPGKAISKEELDTIVREAIDVSAWERSNDAPWPYNVMFDQDLIRYRFKTKHGTANRSDFFNKKSDNKIYNIVKSKVTPKPCNCGRPVYQT